MHSCTITIRTPIGLRLRTWLPRSHHDGPTALATELGACSVPSLWPDRKPKDAPAPNFALEFVDLFRRRKPAVLLLSFPPSLGSRMTTYLSDSSRVRHRVVVARCRDVIIFSPSSRRTKTIGIFIKYLHESSYVAAKLQRRSHGSSKELGEARRLGHGRSSSTVRKCVLMNR